jgi:hypothetical protein
MGGFSALFCSDTGLALINLRDLAAIGSVAVITGKPEVSTSLDWSRASATRAQNR